MAEKILSSQSADVLQMKCAGCAVPLKNYPFSMTSHELSAPSLNAEEIMQTLIRKSLRAVNAEQGVITLGGRRTEIDEDVDPHDGLFRRGAGIPYAPGVDRVDAFE